MPRVSGAKDADHEAKRAKLIAAARTRLALSAPHPSFRELAQAAEVGEATLRHYFGDADRLIAEVFLDYAREGAPYIEHLAQPSGPFATSMADAVAFIAAGQRQPTLRALHRTGQAEGGRRPRAGHAYRESVIDRLIDAVTRRIVHHIAAGEVRDRIDARGAAMALVAPILLAFQHQYDLHGGVDDPIDVVAFLQQHVDAFVAGYAAPGNSTGDMARKHR